MAFNITSTETGKVLIGHAAEKGLYTQMPADLAVLITCITLLLLILGVHRWIIHALKWLRHAPSNTRTAIREWYLPDEYLDSKENADQYIDELQNRGDYDPTKIKNVYKYNKAFDSEGFPDREIIKVNNSYTGVYKDDYRGNDYIYIHRGRVVGRYVPLKRVHPDGNTGSTLQKVTEIYTGYLGDSHKLYTENDRYYIDQEIAEILEKGDQVVFKRSKPVGYIESRDKW